MTEMTNRKPEEIEAEILPLKWKLEELEKELKVSKAVNNCSDYSQYKNKWIEHNAYERGIDYIYVLGVREDDTDLYFYGYGISYDYQTKEWTIVCKDYPKEFYIAYKKNIRVIEEEHVMDMFFEYLRDELRDSLEIN